jgi:tRNA(Ile)-lysidine synthase
VAGVLPVTQEGLIRPLLDCTRAELREWLTARGQTWREDRTNFDTGFAARNRVRAELLPQLRRDWNPQIDQALAHLAAVARAEEEYWDAEIEPLLPEGLIFDRAEMLLRPLAVRRRLLRAAIERAKGDLRRIEFQHVDRALALFERASGDGRVKLPGGVVVERSFGQVRVARGAPPLLPQVRWRVRQADQLEIDAYNRDRLYLDAEKVTFPLTLRSWQAGDLFSPAGSARPKRLKELFQERRVPSGERAGWPMLVSAGTIVWTRCFGLAEGWAAPPGARQVVEVEDSARKMESNGAQLASITVA